MKFQNLSVKRLFGRVAIGFALSMSGITIALFLVTKQTAVLLTGGALLLCALVGIFVLTQAFGKRLSQFTADLCQTLDHMIAGNEAPQRPEDSETQLARIGHRLARLYQIMQENRRRVDEERQELQTLVSDISHQVKTPVSNLKMATDTLLEKPMTKAERTDFIRGIRSQTDKGRRCWSSRSGVTWPSLRRACATITEPTSARPCCGGMRRIYPIGCGPTPPQPAMPG